MFIHACVVHGELWAFGHFSLRNGHNCLSGGKGVNDFFEQKEIDHLYLQPAPKCASFPSLVKKF